MSGCSARSGSRTTPRRAIARGTTGHAVPLGDLRPRSGPAGRGTASRDLYQRELARAGFGAITTEIREAPAFYFAEEYHQQYLAKNPDGYDCHTATGVACPIGLGVKA